MAGGAGTGQSAPRRRSGVSGGVGTLGARRRRYGGAPLPRWPRPQPPPSPCGAPARLTSALRAGPWARLSEPGTPAPVPPAGRGPEARQGLAWRCSSCWDGNGRAWRPQRAVSSRARCRERLLTGEGAEGCVAVRGARWESRQRASAFYAIF